MAAGSFFASRLRVVEQRLVKGAEHTAHLAVRARRMRGMAEQVSRTGDKDVAVEVLIAHHEILVEEQRVLASLVAKPHPKISKETLATLELGNRAELNQVKHQSFATLTLRLHGLRPDDASGRFWTGTTEEISIALHQAKRGGLEVHVLEHDVAARQWHVQYNGKRITMLEVEGQGRPRRSKADPTDADRKHAARYAEAAKFMQREWEARTKAQIDQRSVIEFDHLQVGYAIAGVVNQATLPSVEGVGSKVVVHQHDGTLAGRGKQELGQDPKKFDAPGMRGSEQAPKDSRWITSDEHNRSLDVGRLEAQTPTYRGGVVKLERRPKKALPADWAAVNRPLRVLVNDGTISRWFYVDRFDNAGGPGPASLSSVQRVVDPDGIHPNRLNEMLARNQILRADDPDYTKKLKGGRILVWGGSPTGAWAAERSIHRGGTEITLIGDTVPGTSNWTKLLANYDRVLGLLEMQQISVPSRSRLETLKQAYEKKIADAHGGRAIPRNTKSGSTYDKPIRGRAPGDVQIEFGSPSRIEVTPDGRLLVTLGAGATARSSIFDQIAVAHGQDPGGPGGPAELLGAPAPIADRATRSYGDVPADTIALRPIYAPLKKDQTEPDLLGLESVEPPPIRLLGAAAASPKLAPWVIKSARDGFVSAVGRIAAKDAHTRDHGPISKDSTGVHSGIEAQRDRLPRANEVLAAKSYRLPGSDQTLVLDPGNRARWQDQVRDYLTIKLKADRAWIRVEQMAGGRSKAVLFHVWIGDNDLGVLKIFDDAGGAVAEQKMLNRLARMKLESMKAVRERGVMHVEPSTGLEGDVLLMDAAKGKSVLQMVEALSSNSKERGSEIKMLQRAVARVAEGLAELHRRTGVTDRKGNVEMMSSQAKRSDADHMMNKYLRGASSTPAVRSALGDDFERIKRAAEGPVLDAFLDARVPRSAYHGDANAGNFLVDGFDEKKQRFTDLGVVDVKSMQWSLEGESLSGTKTGAADVARFLASLETLDPGKLRPSELTKLRTHFLATYYKNYQVGVKRTSVDPASYEAAERWYRLELELGIAITDSTAKTRILTLLNLEETR